MDVLKTIFRPIFGAAVVILASFTPISFAVPSIVLDGNTDVVENIEYQNVKNIIEDTDNIHPTKNEIMCDNCDVAVFPKKLDINTASIQQLEDLPKIGPAKAKAIVDARNQRPFRSVVELTRVKGIGKKTALFLQDYVQVHTLSETHTKPSSAK